MDIAYTGKQIAERRKAKDLTQKELAEKLHITDKAVSKWERGINFPDLGLMEALAAALDTTPAVLLGLEDAQQEEILRSMVQLSAQQAEEAQRDICRMCWISFLAAALLLVAKNLFGRDAKQIQFAHILLHGIALAAAWGAHATLRKYGQIKEMDVEDLGIVALCVIPLLAIVTVQWVTGSNPSLGWQCLLIALTAIGFQWFSFRMLKPQWAKAIPLILTAAFAAWHLLIGTLCVEFVMPLTGCAIAYIACRMWDWRKHKL